MDNNNLNVRSYEKFIKEQGYKVIESAISKAQHFNALPRGKWRMPSVFLGRGKTGGVVVFPTKVLSNSLNTSSYDVATAILDHLNYNQFIDRDTACVDRNFLVNLWITTNYFSRICADIYSHKNIRDPKVYSWVVGLLDTMRNAYTDEELEECFVL